MNNSDATDYILKNLKKHRSENDIITSVCNLYNKKWDEAQSLVHVVQNENRQELKYSKNQYIIILAIFFIIFGFALSIGVIVFTMEGLIIFLMSLPIPYLGNLLVFAIGIALIWGGINGLLKIRDQE